jgi:hypothetical protein
MSLAAVLVGNGVLVKSSTSVARAANPGPTYLRTGHERPGSGGSERPSYTLSWRARRGGRTSGSTKVRTTVNTVAMAIPHHISGPV